MPVQGCTLPFTFTSKECATKSIGDLQCAFLCGELYQDVMRLEFGACHTGVTLSRDGWCCLAHNKHWVWCCLEIWASTSCTVGGNWGIALWIHVTSLVMPDRGAVLCRSNWNWRQLKCDRYGKQYWYHDEDYTASFTKWIANWATQRDTKVGLWNSGVHPFFFGEGVAMNHNRYCGLVRGLRA